MSSLRAINRGDDRRQLSWHCRNKSVLKQLVFALVNMPKIGVNGATCNDLELGPESLTFCKMCLTVDQLVEIATRVSDVQWSLLITHERFCESCADSLMDHDLDNTNPVQIVSLTLNNNHHPANWQIPNVKLRGVSICCQSTSHRY